MSELKEQEDTPGYTVHTLRPDFHTLATKKSRPLDNDHLPKVDFSVRKDFFRDVKLEQLNSSDFSGSA